MKLEVKYFNSITPFAKQWIYGDGIFEWLSQNQYYLNHNYGIIDLGSINWVEDHENHKFYTSVQSNVQPTSSDTERADAECNNYLVIPNADINSGVKGVAISTGGRFVVSDVGYESATAAEMKTALSGTYLIYKLVTPRKYGTANLGDLTWTKISANRFSTSSLANPIHTTSSNNVAGDIVCGGYKSMSNTDVLNNVEESSMSVNTAGVVNFYINATYYENTSASDFKTAMSGKQLIFLINDEDYDTIDFSEWTGTITKQPTSKRVRFPLGDLIEPESYVYNYKYVFNKATPNGTTVSNSGNTNINDEYFAVERTDDEVRNHLKGHIFTYKKKVEEEP